MTFPYPKTLMALLVAALLLWIPARSLLASGDHDHEHEHEQEQSHEHKAGSGHDHDEAEEHRTQVQIEPALAQKSGITTALAQGGTLEQTRLLYGRLQADPRAVSQVQARFPGPVMRLNVSLGDNVKAGTVLADVEANESLRRYSISAPINGTVVALNANLGQLVGEQPLLTLANYDRLWVEFRLYGNEQADIRPGQSVHIRQNGQTVTARIEHLLPATGNEPWIRARASLANPGGQWLPGQLVEADLVLSSTEVPLLVDNRALQQVENAQVVFVQTGDTYTSRPLQLGRSDGRMTEILAGLEAGERYVVGNSYLLKADLEKSGAAHEH